MSLIRCGAALLLAVWCAAGSAQTYPLKPLRVVVPFAAGGPTDIVARLLAPKLTEVMGQQVVVENRPGANGLIGVDHVAKSMKELIALARTRRGELNIASTGSGSLPHLALELLKVATKADVAHVPYNGAAPAVAALIGGQVHGMFADLPVLLPHVQGGKLRALAVASPKRAGLLRDLPTMTEQGLPTVEAVNWYGVLVAAATPREIVAKLNDGLVKALSDSSVREKLSARGADPVGNTPEQFGAYLRGDLARWAKLARTTNIRVD